MPKAGFKSITVSEAVYEKFYDTYEESKTDLAVPARTEIRLYTVPCSA